MSAHSSSQSQLSQADRAYLRQAKSTVIGPVDGILAGFASLCAELRQHVFCFCQEASRADTMQSKLVAELQIACLLQIF